MYSLVSAIAKNVEDDTRWHNVNIGDVPLHDILQNYSKITATLSNQFLDHNVSFDLENIRVQYAGSTTTFNQFLLDNGGQALVTSDELPVINTRYVKYADAVHANYKMTPMAAGMSPDAVLPPSAKTWLHVKKKTSQAFDYHLMYRSVLAVVNGFIHATDADDAAFYVQEADKSRQMSGCNMLGFMSFKGIGELSFIPIKPEMVYKQNPAQQYRYQCFVDTQQDLTEKTVMLVLGGYLHVLDEDSFFRVSDSAFCINFNKIPLLYRYYESKKYIDLSSMKIETSSFNDSQIGISEVFSDDAILAYVTLSQSFIVVLDNPDIFMDKLPLKTAPGNGNYVTADKPVYPMIAGTGKLVNYWYRCEASLCSVKGWDTNVPHYLFSTNKPLQQRSISDSVDSDLPEYQSHAHFLKLGTDL